MQFQQISIHVPPPQKVGGNSNRGEGGGKCKSFKEKYGAKLEFPGGGGCKQKTFHGGGYEYFTVPHIKTICKLPHSNFQHLPKFPYSFSFIEG